jgi:hypothetical protein
MRDVTVADLLVLPALEAAELIGAAGRSRRVSMVVAGTSVRQVAELPPGALVVFNREQLEVEDISADIVLRRGLQADIAGIIAEAPPRAAVPLATRRLAEKWNMPLLLLPRVHSTSLAAELDPHVRVPTVAAAATLADSINRLVATTGSPDELVEALQAGLDMPAAIVDARWRIVHGQMGPGFQAGWFADQILEGTTTSRLIDVGDGSGVFVMPAVASPARSGNLWFAVALTAAGAAMIDMVASVLRVAAISFGAHLAAEELRAEREDTTRSLLLTEILDQGDQPSASTVQRATAAQWRLFGWHLAVEIRIRQTPGTQPLRGVRTTLREALARQQIRAPLVPRPDGFAFWLTGEVNPGPAPIARLGSAVRRTIMDVEREVPGLRLCAGIGSAGQGPSGIGRSLQAAHDAAMLAHTRDVAGAVEHIDPLSIKRMLVGWYAQESLQEIASGLLEPLRAADRSGELVHTLRCYLDSESSITTTAAILGLHRNTVQNRLHRIRELLQADLERPDERLAVHLAVRTAESHARDSSGRGRPRVVGSGG